MKDCRLVSLGANYRNSGNQFLRLLRIREHVQNCQYILPEKPEARQDIT